MDKVSILSEIKKLINFSTETPTETVEQSFLDAKANGGEIIVRVEAEAFEVGLPLFVVTEDGLIAAPAGEHILEDGTKVYVDEAGIITEIEAAEVSEEVAPVAEEVVEMAEEEVKVEEEEVKAEEVVEEEDKDKKIEELEERVAEIEKMMTEMLSMTKETANFSSVVLDKLNTFVKETPADLEFKSVKSEYKETVEKNVNTKYSKLEDIKNFRKR